MMMEIRHLTLRAGERVLVEGLDVAFSPRQAWCIAGPNGAGKTTLLNALAGVRALQPGERGEIVVDGQPLPAWRSALLARRRGFMPQQIHDAFGGTVLEAVLAGRHPYLESGRWGAWESAHDIALARAMLEQVQLGALAGRDVTTLSGGERQRVAFAALLAQQAPLLLLDEPVAHLDLHHQMAVLRLLAEHAEQNAAVGHGVVFSCHDLNLARRFASHALLLDGHGGWRAGPAREVLSAEHCSAVFGYPLVLIQDGAHEALVPGVPRDCHE